MTRRVLMFSSLAAAATAPASTPSTSNWERRLSVALPEYGHRNWIVVADSAYPLQSNPSIETQVADTGQLEVVGRVLRLLASAKHVRPTVYLDRELRDVPESDAPGVTEYRRALAARLGDRKPTELLHEQLIAKLDESAKLFRVMIIKTNMTIPYTSVFFQLQCGYWSDDAEQRLRKKMGSQQR